MPRPALALFSLSAAVFAAIPVARASPVAQTPSPIQVHDAWSRPAAAGLPTAVVYMTLTNRGPVADRLQGASSPKAARVSLHRSQMSGGVMSMQPMPEGLALPPGEAVALAPNGYHLMLNGLRGGLQAGRTYPVTLRFAHAGVTTVRVTVRGGPDPMAAMAMPAPH